MKLDQLQSIAASTDLPSLERQLERFAANLEFDVISGALVIDHGVESPISLPFGSIPLAYQAISENRERGRRDPVMQRLKSLSVPFTYDQSTYVKERAGDLWEAQAPHGYKTGVAIALHLPQGRHFLLGVDRHARLPSKPALLLELMSAVTMAAIHAHEAADAIFKPSHRAAVRLSAQEADFLRWRGDGKTAWETAKIVHLSESRVNKVCAAAARKLGCTTTAQAAVKALRLGLLNVS